MAKHFVSVCIFCFLCATHSPCASHATLPTSSGGRTTTTTTTTRTTIDYSASGGDGGGGDDGRDGGGGDKNTPALYVEQLFRLYGDGKRISPEGFERIIKRLDLLQEFALRMRTDQEHQLHHHHHHHQHRDICTPTQVLHNIVLNATLQSDDTFKQACPALLSTLIVGCIGQEPHDDDGVVAAARTYHAWVYSMLAIALISACGILGLLIIPVMQKRFYQPLLQFLVALAVGTLAGDALLHLLPHAMMSHQEEASHDRHAHDANMWKGVVAMLGLILFFFVERFIMLVAKWRKRSQQREKLPTRLKVIKPETSTQLTNASEKQCKHKYSSFPYCYDEIRKEIEDTMSYPLNLDAITSTFANEKNANLTECPDDAGRVNCSEINRMLPLPANGDNAAGSGSGSGSAAGIIMDGGRAGSGSKEDADSVEYTVILREHESRHHGHSHTHGHVHAPPKSITSVAWMVIMGDGLHNFTDGMAIGAAFASSTAGGFSTAVAVFCHELPHELGDFAMLLKAGMTMKQALYYNLLSSVLCLFGNLFGLWLGNTETASSWIFAAAAGMFLYIALVDMIPELSSGHEEEGNFLQCILHLLGLLIGFGVMALIALYEHDLKSIFNET